jgi:hypothetical protein
MKLLFCIECQTTVTLKPGKVRACECGNVKGAYINRLDARFVAKNERYFLIGYANNSFQQAVFDCNKYGEPGGMGVEFTAFVIPEPCQTFVKATEAEFAEKCEKPSHQTTPI